MKKDVYLKKSHTSPDVSISTLVASSGEDPLTFRNYSKTFFEEEYAASAKEIQAAAESHVPVIHIKNDQEKFYKVTTPYCGRVQSEGLEELLYQMYGAIGVINAFPMQYLFEDENILRAVAPRRDSQNEYSSQSPYNDLSWHVDAAYRPMTQKKHLSPLPDYLVFGIVHRGHQSLPMMYIALEDILKQLSKEEIAAGLSPDFMVSSTDSFSQKVVSKNVPLLEENGRGGFNSRITLQKAEPLTKSAACFLDKVRKISDQKSIQNIISVNPGDIVILNNKSTLHKRDRFEPAWNGEDRYFVRIYSVKDLGQGVLYDDSKEWVWM